MLDHPNAENIVPEIGSSDPSRPDGEFTRELKKLTIVRVLRPDRFIAMAR